MKKKLLPASLVCSLVLIFIPLLTKAAIVNCNGPDCTLDKFFEMLGKIYSIIVIDIATPLAVIAVTIGGILMMVSAGNPNMLGLGKKVFWSAIIGLALTFCSYLIINFVLGAVSNDALHL